MYTYKFRLLFDDVEDFVRDYEILAEQTFKDFHDVIIKSIQGLDGKELASFYICDRRWEKEKEITLINMDVDDNLESSGEEAISKTIMSESVLSDFIDDPHQRLIYEYDFLNIKTFYIELLKTFETNVKEKYPRCTYAIGEMPTPALHILDEDINIERPEDAIEEEDNEDYYDDEDFEGLNENLEV